MLCSKCLWCHRMGQCLFHGTVAFGEPFSSGARRRRSEVGRRGIVWCFTHRLHLILKRDLLSPRMRQFHVLSSPFHLFQAPQNHFGSLESPFLVVLNFAQTLAALVPLDNSKCTPASDGAQWRWGNQNVSGLKPCETKWNLDDFRMISFLFHHRAKRKGKSDLYPRLPRNMAPAFPWCPASRHQGAALGGEETTEIRGSKSTCWWPQGVYPLSIYK